jgi:hypothetical protein
MTKTITTSKSTYFYKRSGFAWSIPEILRLQREYELLELSIDEISRLHQRTPYAIAIRLVDEDFASQDQTDIRQYLAFTDYNLNSQENISLCISENSDDDCQSSYSEQDSDSDNQSEFSTLKSQVSDLNEKLDNILEMLRRSNGGSVIGMY